jgi:hypothetical protein
VIDGPLPTVDIAQDGALSPLDSAELAKLVEKDGVVDGIAFGGAAHIAGQAERRPSAIRLTSASK